MDYISRKDALQVVFKSPFFSNALTEEIHAIPAADVAPVRHGQWEKRECGPGEYECKCSACGYRDFMIPWHDNYWFNRNYCPNCGAKMDGET